MQKRSENLKFVPSRHGKITDHVSRVVQRRSSRCIRPGAGRLQDGRRDQALPHQVAHCCRPGRHQCRPGQHGARQLEVAHVRHSQGVTKMNSFLSSVWRKRNCLFLKDNYICPIKEYNALIIAQSLRRCCFKELPK